MANAIRVRTASGWQDIALTGPPGPGGMLATYRQEGESNAYRTFGTGANLTVDAAQSKALGWMSYVPPVDVWAEVTFFAGLVQKTDAAYHQNQLQAQCSPAPTIGTSGALVFGTQHSTVQTFMAYTLTKLYGLAAGIAYSMYANWSFNGGTWQYYQAPTHLWMQGKAWAR